MDNSIKKILLLRVNSSMESAPPPLGLMYIASYLRKKKQAVNIKIVDARCNDFSREELGKVIFNFRPHLLGITSMHDEKKEVHAVAGFIKKTMPGLKIIVGGPYPSADYDEVLKDKNIDFAVVGEGEEVIDELIGDLFCGYQNLSNIKGLAYKEQGYVRFNGEREFIQNLDRLSFPAWDLINLNDYFYAKKRALENPFQIYKRAVPILSSRGCPYRCTYCHSIFGKKFRARSPENIVEEIELLYNSYGVREIEFLDDSFNIDKTRAKNIFDLIIKKNINIKICFSNGIRIDRIDGELFKLMSKSGVYRINYGIESVSKRIQKMIKKDLNIDLVKSIIDETLKNKMLCGAFFMMGFPTETEEEITETLRFAFSSRLHTAVFAIVTPFPNTEIYNQFVLRKKINSNVDFSNTSEVALNLCKVSNKKLQQLRLYAYRRFYFNPIRALRIFFRAPSKIPVFRNFIEVVRVAFFKKVLYSKMSLDG